MTEFFVITLSHPNEAPVVEIAPTEEMRLNLEAHLKSVMDEDGRVDTYRVSGDEHGDYPGVLIDSYTYYS